MSSSLNSAIVLVLVVTAGNAYGSTSDPVTKSEKQAVTLGTRVKGEIEIYTERFTLGKNATSAVSLNCGNCNITRIDITNMSQDATARIAGGGLGTPSILIEFVSSPTRSINAQVRIFCKEGHKTQE